MLTPVCLAFLASASVSNTPALVPASQLLETYADSLTTYKATSKTKVGDLRPLVTQRGVTLDGALRAAPMLPMHLAADPFENVWVGHEKQGDLRIDIGTYGPSEVDIALPSTGWSWVVGRSFNARQTDSGGSQFNSDGPMGKNWALSSQPEIVLYDDATNTKDLIYLVYRADAYVEFDRTGTSSNEYKGKNGAAGCFHKVAGSPDTWEYTDQAGYVFTFLGFNTSGNTYNGLLWKVVDPAGNTGYVGDSSSASTAISNGWDGSGRITKAYDSGDLRRYTYAYTSTSYGGKTRLESVIVETKSGGTWASPTGLTEITRAEYTYYGSETHGDGGDLKTVKITTPLNNFSGESPSTNASQVKKKYYRYWEGSSDNVSSYNSSTNPGYVHALKYVYDYEGVRRYDWLDATFDDDQLGETDDNLKPYAADYFEYDSSHRVNSAWFNGQCGCSGGASGTYGYTFETNGSYSDSSGYTTTWAKRTVVAKPDGSYLTHYFDELGQGLSAVVTDIIPTSSSPTPKKWVTYVVRNSNGCTTEVHSPDNVTAYTHNSGGNPSGAITTSTSAGLVRTTTRTSSGDLTGFPTVRTFQKGTSGTAYYEGKTSWNATTLQLTIGGVMIVRPLVSTAHTYPSAQTSDTGYEETSYSYTVYSGTLMPEKVTTTLPAVTTGNNGSNSANLKYTHYRQDGRVDFEKQEDATIDYHAYTNGQQTTFIQDADTTSLSPPTGFSSSGTALERQTSTTYTSQGMQSSQTIYELDATARHPQTYRSKLKDERMIVLHFPDQLSTTYYGPVSFEVVNQAGKTEVSGVITLTSNNTTSAESDFIDESQSDPLAAIDLGGVGQMRTTIYEESGSRATEERAYFLVPDSGAGSAGTNYDATTFGYDGMGRRWRTKEASGTIRRTVLDAIGRQSESWMGTNDHSFSGGESSGSDNMVKTNATVYDGGADNQNSLVSETKAFIEGSTTGQRLTDYLYDIRGRRIVTLPPTSPYALTKYDNEGHVIATGQYSSSSGLDAADAPTSLATNRMALSESAYDEMGRVWKTTRHMIDDADGSDDDTLTALTWYDSRGRTIKLRGEEYRKTIYDRLGRVTDEYVLAKDNDSGAYSAAGDVAGDIVLEEYQTRYDGTKSDVLMTVSLQRMHSDISGGETTGPLDANGDTDPMTVTVGDCKGRPQISANWHDAFGRVTETVQYGTNGAATITRTGLEVPSRSATALRTSTAYNTDGTVDTVTDPRALVTKYVYDALGRRTKEIKNYDSGVNSGNPYGTDQNVTVSYAYANGLRMSLTAVIPTGGGGDQVTTYIYGTTTGTPSAMKISTGHLLRAVKYPDSTNAGTTQAYIDGTSDADVVSYAYNAQGQETLKKDQAGNVLESVYDDSGRRTINKATTIISGFDDAVKRVETGYDSLGRTSSLVQYDATSSGSATDGVAYTYDDWGNLLTYAEDKDSAVSGGGNQYTTTYAWTNVAATGRYTLRKTSTTLPDSRAITYQYRSAGGLHDDENSRTTLVIDSGVTLAQYDYLGVDTVVRTKLNQISCISRVFDDASPPAYVDLDQFNRITTSRWTKDLSTDRDFYQVTLTYDADSNILSALDGVHGYYNNVGTRWDVAYTMDNVNRLTEAKEGTLSSGSITNEARDEAWTLSHTGNWDVDALDLDGNGELTDAGDLNDYRKFNTVNELTARDTDNNGSTNYAPTYDAAGNMTDDAQDYKYVYDVWGRLRKVKRTASSNLLAEYRYNGLNHRIGVHEDRQLDGNVDGSDAWWYDVFDERWRELARYSGSESSPREDFVPHQAGASGHGGSSYIDLVICRNKDTDVNGSLEERNFYCQNWRADVSAIVSSGGVLKEWAKYSAYGTPIGLPGGDTGSDGVCNATDATQVQTWIDGSVYDVRGDIDLDGDVDATDKTTITNSYSGITLGRGSLSASGVGNRRGYAGYEALSGLVGGKWLARNRRLAADLGRWCQRDPLASTVMVPLYEAVSGNPSVFVDSRGLLSEIPIQCMTQPGHSRSAVAWDPDHPADPPVGPPSFATFEDCCAQCKKWLKAFNEWPVGGRVCCCGGGQIGCSFFLDQEINWDVARYAIPILHECAQRHEKWHRDRNDAVDCIGAFDGVPPPYRHKAKDCEPAAYKVEAKCLKSKKGECGSDTDCHNSVQARIDQVSHYP